MPQINFNSVVKVVNGVFDAGYAALSQVLAQGAQIGSALASATGAIAGACGNIGTFNNIVGVGNTASTGFIVLATLPIPANAFDQANRIATVNAAGKFAANANNKQVRIYFGSDVQTVGAAVVTTNTTLIADSGVVTTNGGGWFGSAQVLKTGANGSNTQLGINTGFMAGSTHLGTTPPIGATATESAVSYVTLVGASPTTGAANDVLAQWLELFWDN